MITHRFLSWLLPALLLPICLSAQTTEPLPLLARPHGDSIVLRWAPADVVVWEEMRKYGVTVERRSRPTEPWRAIHSERRIAYTVEDFKDFTDTEDPHIVAVAEALYGEAAYDGADPSGPMGMLKRQLDDQENRYFLAVVNADLSAPAASALGWRIVDRRVKRGVPYSYRVRTVPPATDSLSTFTSPTIQLRSNDAFPFGPVRGLEVVNDDKKVTLSWPRRPHQDWFIGYYLEESTDGHTFARISELPLVKTEAGKDSDRFQHQIELAVNYQPRNYRLSGINAFAEVSPVGTAVRGWGVDKSPPPRMSELRSRDEGRGGFELQWTIPRDLPTDLRGIRVARSLSYDGPFVPVHAGFLPGTTRAYSDTSAQRYRSNFYVIQSVDTTGNVAESVASMAVWRDSDPPAPPTGLTGRIDTNGNVFLFWETGPEPDLLGYRVFAAHAKEREFRQLTERIAHENFYFDSTSLRVLNEVIHYRVVALDQNFNPSGYSEILTLRRPDKLPPAAPVWTGASARGSSVELRWRPSQTSDVVAQELWRREPGQAWRPVHRLLVTDSMVIDTGLHLRTRHEYRIQAVDEAGWYGSSPVFSINSGLITERPPVGNWRIEAGEDGPLLSWEGSGEALSGYQLYAGKKDGALRPLRWLPPETRRWPVGKDFQTYAIRALYADGGKSPLSDLLSPAR